MIKSGQSSFTLPTAFDTSLGTNFTQQSCPDYFATFLKNETFINCYPMSFYLKNSQSYVDIVRNGLEAVEYVLNASCSVDYKKCSQVMSDISQGLISSSYCAHDYSLQNPLVIQAVNDFAAYGEVFQATCLRLPVNQTEVFEQSGSVSEIITESSPNSFTPTSVSAPITSILSQQPSASISLGSTLETLANGKNKRQDIQTIVPEFENYDIIEVYPRSVEKASYCYSDALFSMIESSADDAYLYLLPLGISFPNTSTPSCSACTKQVMAIFHSYTNNASNVITNTYGSASGVIAEKCPNTFVNTSTLINNHETGSHNEAIIRKPNLNVLSLIVLFLSIFSLSFVL